MHNEEIGVIDIELNGLKKILHGLLLRSVAVDEVFARSAQHNLTGNADLRILFEADGRFLFIAVVEDYRDARLGDTCLSTLVYEILKFVSSWLLVASHVPCGVLPASFALGLLSCW